MKTRFSILSKSCAILCTACITIAPLSKDFQPLFPWSAQSLTAFANTTDTQKVVNALYIQYIGPTITQPTTLSASDFLVTAVYEDGTREEIKEYTFTSSLQITSEGETCISGVQEHPAHRAEDRREVPGLRRTHG